MNTFWQRVLPYLALVVAVSPLTALGNAETAPNFDLVGFREIEVQAGIQVELVSGPFLVQPLTQPLPEDLDVRVEGNRLILGYHSRVGSFHRSGVRFRVVLPTLGRLELSGGAGAQIGVGVDPDQFLADLSGGAQVRGTVVTNQLRVNLSGGSHAYLEGEVGELFFDASGGAGLDSPRLRAQKARLSLSGGASADLTLGTQAFIEASGGSHVRYSGQPRLENHLSGGSSVRGY